MLKPRQRVVVLGIGSTHPGMKTPTAPSLLEADRSLLNRSRQGCHEFKLLVPLGSLADPSKELQG